MLKKLLVFLFLVFSISIIANAEIRDTITCDTLKPHKKKKRSVLVLPIVISTPETQLGGGLIGSVFFKIKNDSSVRTSNIQSFFIVTTRKQIVVENGGNLFFRKENYIIRWMGTYSNFPDRFYGIGNDSKNSNKETYTYKQIYLTSQFTKRIYKKLYFGFDYELQDAISIDYTAGGLFDQQNVYGRNGGVASGLGLVTAWDNRNNAFYPNKGAFMQFSAIPYRKFLGSDFTFDGYYIDLRKYFKSYTRNVLALQIYTQLTSGNVPFRSLATLGGPFLLRGYYLGRYRDDNSFVVQGEYRLYIYKKFGATVFGGLGEVTHHVGDIGIDNLKYSVGAGLRYFILPKEKVNIRLDFAFGQNSAGFYLYLAEAF